MSDPRDKPPVDLTERKAIDGAAYVIRGVVYGLFNSGFVRPLLIIGALNAVLERVATEFLQIEYNKHGRAGYDQAKVAVLNLSSMSRVDLDAFVRAMDQSITEAELRVANNIPIDPKVTH